MQPRIAPAEPPSPALLQQNLEALTRNPIIDSLLHSFSGFLAVLDAQGRIMTVNASFLEFLGNDNPLKTLGSRLGEAIACIHARDARGGCGSTRFCASCGAGNAIQISLSEDKPVERICAATVVQDGQEREMCFQVRSSPILMEERKFILLLMQDITTQHTRAALERVFFHDIGNILTSLLGATENLDKDRDNQKLIEITRRAGRRLRNEIEIQRTLSRANSATYQLSLRKIRVDQIVQELEEVISQHEAAAGKELQLPDPLPDLELLTDSSLLHRILLNMLTNAFEATDPGGQVKLRVVAEGQGTTFMVWNAREIAPEIRPRIFQRHFSTKGGQGRGLGTYSMKLFGEKILYGKVDFSSSAEDGTTFRLMLA